MEPLNPPAPSHSRLAVSRGSHAEINPAATQVFLAPSDPAVSSFSESRDTSSHSTQQVQYHGFSYRPQRRQAAQQ
jgi:hypothetical protein